MSILWLIIKIILMILLIILGLMLVIVGIVLFSPIRYEGYWAKYEALSYDIKITYLMGIKGIFYLDEEKKNHTVSLFGRVLYKNEDEKVLCSNEEDKTEGNNQEIGHLQTKQMSQEGKKTEKVITQSTGAKEKVVEEKEKINPQLKKEFKVDANKVGKKVEEETVKTVEEMPYAWAKKLILDKRTYSAIKEVLKCIWRVIKTIWPYEWDFELIVGEEEPGETGELIAKLTMLYPLYCNHGVIQGDYEKACLEGGFLVKGKFTIGHIIGHIIRCLLSHSVRDFIKLIIALRKEEQNGK